MRLTIAKKEALRVLELVVGASERKSALPALANILIATELGHWRASATDLYFSASASGSCDGADQAESIALPALDLLARIKAMPEGPVELRTEEGETKATLKTSVGARRYTVHGLPGHEFPKLPTLDACAGSISLSAEQVRRMLSRVSYAMSEDVTRPHVNGTLWEWEPGMVRFAATDGHRLSLAQEAASGIKDTKTFVLPHKGVVELAKLAAKAEGEIKIATSGSLVWFCASGVDLSIKLADAVFPPYRQVIPARVQAPMRLVRKTFADALKAVSLAAADRTGAIKLRPSAGKLRLTSDSPESGNGFDELDVDYAGPEITIGFNVKFLLDVLGAIDCEEILLFVGNELDPVMIRTSADSDDFAGVVMPMRC